MSTIEDYYYSSWSTSSSSWIRDTSTDKKIKTIKKKIPSNNWIDNLEEIRTELKKIPETKKEIENVEPIFFDPEDLIL